MTPKYRKSELVTTEEPIAEAALIDKPRFAKIWLIDCVAGEIRKVPSPMDNGPDLVIDEELVREECRGDKLGSKRVPLKASLLDQVKISGMGNSIEWI